MLRRIRKSKTIHDGLREVYSFFRTIDEEYDSISHPLPNAARFGQTLVMLWEKYVYQRPKNDSWQEYLSGHEVCFRPLSNLFFDTCREMVERKEIIWTSESDLDRVEEWAIDENTSVLVPFHRNSMGWALQNICFCEKEKVKETERVWGDKFWKVYGGLITFEISTAKRGLSATPVALTIADDRKYVGPHNIERLEKYIQAFEAKGFNRSFLFQGPPGTGKTTIAYQLAKSRSGRALHLSIPLIEGYFGTERINDVIEVLRPSVILLDDIHLMGVGSKSDLLHMLEWVNEHPSLGTLLIATSNEISGINRAMRRPGRFDEILIFGAPDKDERREVLELYSKLYGCWDFLQEQDPDLIDRLVFYSHGLTHAFMKDLAKSISSLRDMDSDSFLRAINQRLVGMRIASDLCHWNISDVALDVRAPIPTEKSLQQELAEAANALEVVKARIKHAHDAGIESGEDTPANGKAAMSF